MSNSEKLNPWLREKLRRVHSPQKLDLIIETEPDKASAVASDLARLPKVDVHAISWGRFIPISAPIELIPQISEIPYVRKVSYNMPKTIKSAIIDPLLGEVKLSQVEVPGSPLDRVLSLPFAPLSLFFDVSKPGYEFIPTSKVREIIGAPEDNTITTKVAILDTGAILPFHPLANRMVEVKTVIPEPPWDMLGHGVFCHTAAFLGDAQSRFGRVRGVADALSSLHVKCMNNMGFGTTSSVLEAMEAAYKWGAKVISLSLGGPLQGSAVHDDPESKVVNEIKDVLWVVAAGNEGPADWTIDSPGASPNVLTVGSYSTKYGDVSLFSSRGPSGQFYRDNPDVWQKDLAECGDDLIKPDILCVGGGPCKEGQSPIDLIVSGSQGWTDGEYDYAVDGFTGMRGSSMAAAVAAGLVALLYEKKGIRSTKEIKAVMSQLGKKDSEKGYGLIRYDMF
jgi:subtilisin family serine protease